MTFRSSLTLSRLINAAIPACHQPRQRAAGGLLSLIDQARTLLNTRRVGAERNHWIASSDLLG